MCLAIPAKVVKIISKEKAIVDYGGNVKREVNTSFVDVKVGDYVIVHAGFAIQKLNEEEAKKSLETWEEILNA